MANPKWPTYQGLWGKTPTTLRCYPLKRSTDARKRCINLKRPKYSMIVAENRGLRREMIWDFFSLIWDFFAIFCHASRYRARFQASSGHSDSANRRGCEAGQNQFRHGKINFITAKSISPRQNQFHHGKIICIHGKLNFTTAKSFSSTAKLILA